MVKKKGISMDHVAIGHVMSMKPQLVAVHLQEQMLD
jgi:hypothetical protein